MMNNYVARYSYSWYILNETHGADSTTKDGAYASADWYTVVKDAKCDINVVA